MKKEDRALVPAGCVVLGWHPLWGPRFAFDFIFVVGASIHVIV